MYGPRIVASSETKSGIMQAFINNKGRVNAFKTKDTVIQLRKPQVYKVKNISKSLSVKFEMMFKTQYLLFNSYS